MKMRGYIFIGSIIFIGALLDKSLISSWIGYTWFSLPLLCIILLSFYQQKYWPLAVGILAGFVNDLFSDAPKLTYLITFSLIAVIMMIVVRTSLSHRSFLSLFILSIIGSAFYYFVPLVISMLYGTLAHTFIPKITQEGLLAVSVMVGINVIIGAITISFYYRRPHYKLRPYIYS